jgi:3'-phosphoadenosine 5'-phosphosulfate sulfotransferase (PAPS reductase)/FAD synthetase
MSEQDFGMQSARLHAKLPAHRRAVERAADRVRLALATVPGTWAASVSGGKDSAALLSVALAAGWRGPVFHFRYSGDYETDSPAMARQLADMHGLEYDEILVASEFDAFERAGHFFTSPTTAGERAAVRWWQTTHQRQVSDHIAARGWAGVFIGMRREESRVRAMMLRQKGPLYSVKGRTGMTCCPLLDWSGRDVWGRIASEGLPYLARYDDALDRIRERSEDIWMSVDIWKWGMGADIKRRNPDAWHTLCSKYPALSMEK